MKKETIGKYLAILGLLLFWAPFWGIVDSYFVMQSSFQEITLFGTNEPKINQSEMSLAAIHTAIGFLLFMLAIVLLAVSIIGLNYRTNWLFWLLIAYSTLLILTLPLITLLGLAGAVILVILVLSRKKFGAVNRIS